MIATQVELRDRKWIDLKAKYIYFQRQGVLRNGATSMRPLR